MKTIRREHVDELLEYLDCQGMHLERVLTFLDDFRRALIRRDAPALERMQAQMEQESQVSSELEDRRRHLLRQFAEAIGCRQEEVCLSEIRCHSEPMQQELLRKRQEYLKGLTDRLRQQHLATELLVREYARMNRRLLETLRGQAEKGKVYDARGRSDGMADSGWVSVRI